MSFIWPWMLPLLISIPIIALVYIFMQQRRQKYALRYASLSLVREAVGRGHGWRRHLPAVLFLTALAFMLIALARPEATTLVPSPEGMIVLTMDVSGSMSADDLQPNRLDAMKVAARAFIDNQPDQVRVAIVTFSDNSFVVQPPTSDKEALIAAVNRLQWQRGTAIGRGLVGSLDVIAENDGALAQIDLNQDQQPTVIPQATPLPKGQYQNAIVILLSDGENNQWPEPLDIAQIAAERRVRVYTVGIGSAEGAIVRIQGRAIRTRLDEATLQQIAEMTDGQYFNAKTEGDLLKVYQNLSTNLELKTAKTEVTAYASGVAMLFALLAGILSLLWFNHLP